MESASSNAGTPAQKQNRTHQATPPVFEWYENRAEQAFQQLYREDVRQRQLIVEIIHELSESNLFFLLAAKFEDAQDLAIQAGQTGNDEMMAFAARMYIAGSLRGCAVIDL